MIDLHTHILPKMDDGAGTVELSLEMLRRQADQGVGVVVLTPHFYRDQEDVKSFLHHRARAMARLQAAIDSLPKEEQERLPKLVLGAEVAWQTNMKHWDDLDRLCIGSTRNLLLEMPNSPWGDQVLNTIYNLLNRGITPVLAHIERYFQPWRGAALDYVMSMGVPIQVSSGSLLRPFLGRKLIRFVEREDNIVLASDCHDMAARLPNMAEGVERLRQKLDPELVEEILLRGKQLITP